MTFHSSMVLPSTGACWELLCALAALAAQAEQVGKGRQVRRLGRRQVGKRRGGRARGGGIAEPGSGEDFDGDVEAVIAQRPAVSAAGLERGGGAWLVEDDIGEECRRHLL